MVEMDCTCEGKLDIMERAEYHYQYQQQRPGVKVFCADRMNATKPNRASRTSPYFKSSLHHSVTLVFLILTFMAARVYSFSCPAPPICSCEINDGKQIINCRRKALTTVPTWNTGSSTPFYELTLAHNDITTLANDAFNGLIIQRLDLSENPITSIESGAFSGLANHLEELVLHVNNVDTFPKDALSQLAKLRILYIKGLNLPSLPENALTTLSKLEDVTFENCGLEVFNSDGLGMSRVSLHTLSLPFNKLTQVPSVALALFENLRKLDLQHNKLEVLSNGFLSQNVRITTLEFSNNGIATIQTDAFVGLEASLTNLVLKSNKITDNQLPPIGILRKLENLNLAFNNIRNLNSNMFAELQALQNLNVRVNHISQLNREVLSPTKNSLQYLDLSQNAINSIETGLFQGFTVLKEIHLDDQEYSLATVLDETTFQGLQGSLQRLSLANVGFKTENFPSVTHLGKLQWLSLKNNAIGQIPNMTFQHLSELVTLDLSNNSVSSLSQAAMHGMQTSLIEIDLVNNQIQTIPECTFRGYTSMDRLKLGKNPLRCDCDLVWLRRWIARFENSIEFLLIDWKCQSPSGLQDQKFRDLSIGDLCNTDQPPKSCPVIELSTTTSTIVGSTQIPGAETSTLMGSSLVLNTTQITHESVLLRWRVQDDRITGFNIETTANVQRDQQRPPVIVGASVREYKIEKLSPATKYITCVTSLYNEPDLKTKVCTDFITLEKSEELVQQAGSNVGAIVGAVIGVLVFIILLIILGFWFVRSRSELGDTCLSSLKFGKGENGENARKRRMPTGIPKIGYNSKRFSRPKGATASTTSSQLQNYTNDELEKKLAGFSEDERDRIMNILTTTGGSTASIISSGSSTRYAPELPPRPQSMEGYLNPQSVKEEDDDIENHIYSEIPGAGYACYEEPRNSSSFRDSGISDTGVKYQTHPPQTSECYI